MSLGVRWVAGSANPVPGQLTTDALDAAGAHALAISDRIIQDGLAGLAIPDPGGEPEGTR